MPDPLAQPASVNLLEHENLDDSVINRLVTWAVTYGRYIMIGTEVIVLLAFISRFSLDRKLTDLREEIKQKQIILQANQKFENEFKTIQKRLNTVRSLLNNQTKRSDALFLIHSLLPQDVYLTEFSLSDNKITFGAISGTTTSFSQFLSLITSEKKFETVELTELRRNTLHGIEFRVSTILK